MSDITGQEIAGGDREMTGSRLCDVRGFAVMALYRILQNSGFDPETITIMSTAFERARDTLGLVDRSDPLTELVARKVIEVAQTGVRDPAQMCDQALAALRQARG